MSSSDVGFLAAGVESADGAGVSRNLLRAAGALASLAYPRARAATLRRDLIGVAGRTARHGRVSPLRPGPVRT